MKITEACELFYLHFSVKIYEGFEQRRVRKQFYPDAQFKALDQSLLKGPNPYRIPGAFPYGETPLCSLKKIADRCGLQKRDKLVDLGCGRGRGVFFLSHFYGCEAIGVDQIQPFMERACHLAETFRTPRVSFLCKDMRKFDFSQATFVFFYGTTFSEEFIQELIQEMRALPKGSKIAAVSTPLEGFKIVDQFRVSFNWGFGDVYLHLI